MGTKQDKKLRQQTVSNNCLRNVVGRYVIHNYYKKVYRRKLNKVWIEFPVRNKADEQMKDVTCGKVTAGKWITTDFFLNNMLT